MNKLSGKKHIIIASMLLVVAVIGMIFAMNRNDSSSSEEKLLQAKEYFDLLDYDKVVAIYNDIIASDKSCAEAYIGLAEVYNIRGNSAKSLEILERGLENTNGDEALQNKINELFSPDDIDDIKAAENELPDDGILTESTETEDDNLIIPADITLPAETTAPEETTVTEETTTTPPETTTTAAPETTTAAAPIVTAAPVTTTSVWTTTTPPATTTETTTTAKPKSIVPNFVGMTEREAAMAAENSKLTLKIVYEKGSTYPDGTVFKQGRSEGDRVKENSQVTVYICQFDKELHAFYDAVNEWGSSDGNIGSVTLNEKSSSVTINAVSTKKFIIDSSIAEAFRKCSGATLYVSTSDLTIAVSSSSVTKNDKIDISSDAYGNESRMTVEFAAPKNLNCTVNVTVKNCKISSFTDKKLYRENKKIGDVTLNGSNQPAFSVSSPGAYVIK